VELRLHFSRHPSEHALEAYAFRRLSEEETAGIEEHLLACDSCQDALQEVDLFIQAAKATMASPVPQIATKSQSWKSLAGNLSLGAAFENLAWGGALAAVLLILLILPGLVLPGLFIPRLAIPWARSDSPTAAVTLSSLRGTEEVSMAHAPSRRPLDITINAADISLTGVYRIEIVNAIGKPSWNGTLTVNAGKLTASVPTKLDAGIYWVRLYAAQTELLREFELKLE